MGFVATVATRWFDARRGLVTGVLTAASATGQLIFLPIVAEVTTRHGWRWASLIVAAAALAVVPLVAVFMRNHPQDKGLTAYGATGTAAVEPAAVPASSFRAAFDGLLLGARVPAFWLLAASFAICGMTTNGLIGTHFIPAANDHGMPTTVAAGLLATIGILDVAGTVFSGWLTDRVDPRLLLVVYYTGRGVSLLLLPSLLSPHAEPSTWVFVIFYGLDWVATVPPTIVLCRNYFGTSTPVVFGWVFASHQVGAAIAAAGAGRLRDLQGNYDLAFYLAAGLCFVAAALCANVRKAQVSTPRHKFSPILTLALTRSLPLTCLATDELGAESEDSHQQGNGRSGGIRRDRRIGTAGDQRIRRPGAGAAPRGDPRSAGKL